MHSSAAVFVASVASFLLLKDMPNRVVEVAFAETAVVCTDIPRDPRMNIVVSEGTVSPFLYLLLSPLFDVCFTVDRC